MSARAPFASFALFPALLAAAVLGAIAMTSHTVVQSRDAFLGMFSSQSVE
jgi:hypothetical protein